MVVQYFSILILGAVCISAAEPTLVEIKKAAEEGDPAAQKKLAEAYSKTSNYGEAHTWYKKASVAGDPDVLFQLGKYYHWRHAEKGTANKTNAIILYTLAAAQGHKQAQHDLGVIYVEGKLVTKDPSFAYELFRRAHSTAQLHYLDQAVLGMSAAQVEAAEKKVKEFKPRTFPEAFRELVESKLELQAVAGTTDRMMAVINGKTLEKKKTFTEVLATIPVEIRCEEIQKRAVKVSFLGGTSTLQLK